MPPRLSVVEVNAAALKLKLEREPSIRSVLVCLELLRLKVTEPVASTGVVTPLWSIAPVASTVTEPSRVIPETVVAVED
jgi:hypothetical protein